MEKQTYHNQPRSLWRGVVELGRSAVKNIRTQPPKRTAQAAPVINKTINFPPMPTHFDHDSLFPEFYGTVEELPLSWDKHGYPHYADDGQPTEELSLEAIHRDIENSLQMDEYPYSHSFDSKPTRDIRSV